MRRHELLAGLHDVLQPRTYFEIGVRNGLSLALSRARSVAVDPFFSLTKEIRCDVHLVRTTSDEFFARPDPFAHLDPAVVDLAFIDGMHLSEYALRDLINTERFCHPGSVVVLDDVLPRTVTEAGRRRVGAAEHGAWTGDVYKVIETLETLRPELVALTVDTHPTGTLVLLNLDPRSRVLLREYDQVVRGYFTPDPQHVPTAVLQRSAALTGQELLSSPVWAELRAVRGLPTAEASALTLSACHRAGLDRGVAA